MAVRTNLSRVDSFSKRSRYHDQIALPAVKELFLEEYSLTGHVIGAEIDYEALRESLRANLDLMSLKFRYRPDILFTSSNPKVPALLAEIKCEVSGYNNWAIEFFSYLAAKEWDAPQKNVIYIFVEIDGESEEITKMDACWCNSVRFPLQIKMPTGHRDYHKNKEWVKENYPHVLIDDKYARNGGGSGTPFFTIPKASNYLKGIELFMTDTFGFEVKESDEESIPVQLSFLQVNQ